MSEKLTNNPNYTSHHPDAIVELAYAEAAAHGSKLHHEKQIEDRDTAKRLEVDADIDAKNEHWLNENHRRREAQDWHDKAASWNPVIDEVVEGVVANEIKKTEEVVAFKARKRSVGRRFLDRLQIKKP